MDAGQGLASLPGAGATITVTLNDARTYDATIVGIDSTTDLAVLFLANPPSDLTPIALGDSASLAVERPGRRGAFIVCYRPDPVMWSAGAPWVGAG